MCSSMNAVRRCWRSFTFCENSKCMGKPRYLVLGTRYLVAKALCAFRESTRYQLLITNYRFSQSPHQRSSAVHDDRLSRHIGSAITSEQHGNLGDLRGLSQVLDRLLAYDSRLHLLVFPVVLAQHGLDQAWSDRVDAHAFGPKFERVGLRHHEHGRFRHAVQQPVKLRTQAGNGRNIDDRAGPPFAHPRGNHVNETKRALQVDLDHFVELAFVHLDGRTLSNVGGGVVYQDVDASELAGGGVHQALDLVGFADMACQSFGCGADLLRDLVECFLFASANDHGCAFADESLVNGPANSTTCAGDDSYFAFE